MNRREMLKQSLFGGAFLTGSTTMIDQIAFSNSAIEDSPNQEGCIAPRQAKAGAVAIAYGTIHGGKDFPLRCRGIDNPVATDGSLIYFVWPSERGDARGYIKPLGDTDANKIVFRLRMGRPEPPYYLRWRKGDYYLYTPPGALIKRASALIAVRDEDESAELSHIQALSDMRMAVLINLTFSGNGQDVLDRLAELDTRIRQDTSGIRRYWNEYRELLSETKKS
ncbi:MAG: hypothetical protein HY231_23685 [Acidobacteria bacterium]|nr:hypothetical protein [Acidobacteriota bacterium]